MSLYQQKVPDQSLSSSALELLDSFASEVMEFKAECTGKSLPLITNLRNEEYLESILETAEKLKEFKRIVVLGTGGSSLTGQALTAISQQQMITFVENIDPETFDRTIKYLNPKDCAYIVISKSGETIETITQCLVSISLFLERVPDNEIKNHFYFISDPTNNTICTTAKKFDCTVLDHEPDIGGRYSIFTNVGLLPAALSGLEIKKIRNGAIETLEEFIHSNDKDNKAVMGALLNILMLQKNIGISITMPYVDRLESLTSWYRQIWAESLGKEGKGSLPARARGTVDQHSQLQLYLDGPKDKFFTLINLNNTVSDFVIDGSLVEGSTVSYLGGKNMGQIIDAEYKSTRDALIKNNCPLRELIIEKIDEESIGALAMHFILETILTAKILSINPFDQPAVEEVKSEARKILGGN